MPTRSALTRMAQAIDASRANPSIIQASMTPLVMHEAARRIDDHLTELGDELRSLRGKMLEICEE